MKTSFFLDVPPLATERSRCTCRGRFATVYTAPKYREWMDEALPKLAALGAGREASDRPLKVDVQVIARRPKTTKLAAPRGDNDNYEKGLWDAITKAGLWWVDDKQIVENRTVKRWAEDGEPEGYLVEIEFL